MSDYTTEKEQEILHDVYDENNPLANSTLIPNIIDDMGLSPYAVRLYIRFKRRVNQRKDGSTSGSAYDSTMTLANDCKISTGQVTNAKRELVRAGLIRIRKEKGRHGEFSKDHVIIVDIWKANAIYYSNELTIINRKTGEHLNGKEARKYLSSFPKSKISTFEDFIRTLTGAKHN